MKTIQNNHLNGDIYEDIILHRDKELKEFKFPVIFFNKLTLKPNNDKENCYFIDMSKIDKKINLLDEVVISLHIDKSSKILSALIHELFMHGMTTKQS